MTLDANGETVRNHSIDLESTGKPGHYKLHIIAQRAFYLGAGNEFEMYYSIRNRLFEGETQVYFYQVFLQEQDPTKEESFIEAQPIAFCRKVFRFSQQKL